MDMREYTNKAALTLHEHSPIERAFELFRAIGIRHLTIIDRQNNPVGMITRKDIMTNYSHNLM